MFRVFRTVILHILVVGGTLPFSTAQSFDPPIYGNEWFEQGQKYYKFVLEESGIYRIRYRELAEAGIPINSINSNRFQIFSLGKEIPIRVSTEGALGVNDYIEFFGRGNDGSLDAELYRDAEKEQLNPKYSIYTDSMAFFLTWAIDPTIPTARFTQRNNGTGNAGLPPKENYYLHEIDTVFHEFYFKPTHDGRNYIRYSNLDIAEGFGSPLKHSSSIDFHLEGWDGQGLDASLEMRFGTNILSRSLQIRANGFTIKNVTQNGFGIVQINEKINSQIITNSNLNLSIQGLTGENEKHTIGYVKIKYPRAYDFENVSSQLYYQQPSIISRYIEVENFNYSGDRPPVLYNLDDKYFMETKISSDKVTYVVPASFAINQLILVGETGIKSVGPLTEVKMNHSSPAGNYVILSNSKLFGPELEEYANYRRSEAGGSYDVSVIDVNELYNQFGYGIHGHVIAITRFFKHLFDTGDFPEYVFIVGKGREFGELRIRNDYDDAFVPTYGVPGSDNLLVTMDKKNYPEIPIGRIAVTKKHQIKDYLDKVRTHENPESAPQTISEQQWKKNIVHLSGGSVDIQEILFGYLQSMESLIAYNKFGAEVTTFRKTSADPILGSLSQQIIDQINKGSFLVTFFGHSAVGTFDFSLEDPSKYDNAGRNPIIVSLGCHSGNIHTPFPGISEEFVLEKSLGSIAFIASSGTAFPGPQFQMGKTLYDLIGGDMYGRPIGEVFNETLKRMSQGETIDIITLLQQFTFHGDPAYKYHTFKGPDFVIDNQSVVVSPGLIHSSTDKINLSFDVVNLGATIDEELNLKIIRQGPEASLNDTIELQIPSPSFRAPIEVEFLNHGFQSVGLNKIFIQIDPKNEVREEPSERAEENNQLVDNQGEKGFRFFIFDNSAKPIYPREFSIVSDLQNLELTSAINNAFAPGGTFVIQIDTTEEFNSSFLKTKEIENKSSLIKWRPDPEALEGQVYYWRISPKNEVLENHKSEKWRTSSFVFLPNESKGWNQSHYYQWLKNSYSKLEIQDDPRRLEFSKRTWDIRIKNELNDPTDFWVFVNNTPWASLNPKNLAPGLAVFIWDENNVLFKNNGTDFGSLEYSQDGFIYRMDKHEDRQNIISLLNAAPEGSRVFVHTILEDELSDLNVGDWTTDEKEHGFDLFTTLEGYGARKVRELLDRGTVPYTLIFDKGKGLVVEDIANTILETIDISATGTTIWENGEVTSVEIESAERWMRLLWDEDKDENDRTSLQVFGIEPGGQKTLLKNVKNDYSVNLTSIHPDKYPRIQLKYLTEDPIDKTSAQLKYWRVLTRDLPDAALYSDKVELPLPDTVNAGENIDLNFEIRNLTGTSLEPILIQYRLVDTENQITSHVKRTEGISGFGSILVNEQISSDGLNGQYRLEIEVNPNQEQKEVTSCNNLGYTDLFIRPDQNNPFLDVTFDGRHISDGEIIHETPEIVIELYDDRSHVLLDNPEDFFIRLYYPDVLVWNIDEKDDGVEFLPATNLDENRAKFIIRPRLNAEGRYRLEVRGRDASGNYSGAQPYNISFQIGQIDPETPFRIYPNPMKDYTDIEYYLSGDRVPEIFRIDIYAANGIRVKRVTKGDFGGIYPGINKYRWDGRDESGRVLESGIYFYELINNLDTRATKKKGSVVIMK